MSASIELNFGAKGKSAYTMFDGVIDVICSQNTEFRRVYAMRANLAAAFGDPLVAAGRVYHASPTPAQRPLLRSRPSERARSGTETATSRAWPRP